MLPALDSRPAALSWLRVGLRDATVSIRPAIADSVLVVAAAAKCGRMAALTRPARWTGSSVVAVAMFDGLPTPAALMADTR